MQFIAVMTYLFYDEGYINSYKVILISEFTFILIFFGGHKSFGSTNKNKINLQTLI